MLLNAGSIDVSRADDDIGPLPESDVEKLIHLFNRSRQIRVRKQHILSGCGQNTLSDRVSFAVILGILQKAQALHVNTPDNFRPIGATRNVDEWYAAFGVTPGQKLYLAPAERVRAW